MRAAARGWCEVRMPEAKGRGDVVRSLAVRVMAEGNMRVILCHADAHEA